MIEIKKRNFSGFDKETINFLINLHENNNREWFESNKNVYKMHILRPMQDFVMDLGDTMLQIDPQLDVSPFINKTIARIHRDIRFSKDKTPYKNNMWITFKRKTSNMSDIPTFYFEFNSNVYNIGMGFYNASSSTMLRLRNLIATKPRNIKKIVNRFGNNEVFSVRGEKYKRIQSDDIETELQDWYQRKNIYLECSRKIDELFFDRQLVDDVAYGFTILAPLYNFFWSLKT